MTRSWCSNKCCLYSMYLLVHKTVNKSIHRTTHCNVMTLWFWHSPAVLRQGKRFLIKMDFFFWHKSSITLFSAGFSLEITRETWLQAEDTSETFIALCQKSYIFKGKGDLILRVEYICKGELYSKLKRKHAVWKGETLQPINKLYTWI